MQANYSDIEEKLFKILKQFEKVERDYSDVISSAHHENKNNAINLLHYLSFRSKDFKDLQHELHLLGLSSLASAESHISGQIEQVLKFVSTKKMGHNLHFCRYEEAIQSFENKIKVLFGKNNVGNDGLNIMVTIDGALAYDKKYFYELLKSGMNIARINCAHDSESEWKRIIDNIKSEAKKLNKACKIYMDLAGPKIRTVTPNNKALSLEKGDIIMVTIPIELPNKINEKTIACSLPEIILQLKKGERILMDDGLVEAEIFQVKQNAVLAKVKRISTKKNVIKPEKGMNFPDTDMQVAALTLYDMECIPFISKYADMVGYSFVKNPRDISTLRKAFSHLPMPHFILKIETLQAVYQLPQLLFEAMKEPHFGLMIARGDLAVEIGFEKLSEIQEEILWICEAAQIPVIWATQVLESLNKSGLATRSEITDASHASMADCVMINKGANTIKVIEMLKDIASRKQNHQLKKRYIFRKLKIAAQFFEND